MSKDNGQKAPELVAKQRTKNEAIKTKPAKKRTQLERKLTKRERNTVEELLKGADYQFNQKQITDYDPEVHDPMLLELGLKGASVAQVINALGVSKETMLQWKNNHARFAWVFAKCRDLSLAFYERKMQNLAQYTTGPSQIRAEVAIFNLILKTWFKDEYGDNPPHILVHSGPDIIQNQLTQEIKDKLNALEAKIRIGNSK